MPAGCQMVRKMARRMANNLVAGAGFEPTTSGL
jgi:hypothetical protein